MPRSSAALGAIAVFCLAAAPGTPPPSDSEAPPAWAKTHWVEKDGSEADLLVQVGDVDNLGFGWPKAFDPFSGQSTRKHKFPYAPTAEDPTGTDRIMVITGHVKGSRTRTDGYTRTTRRPKNNPEPIRIEFDPAAVQIQSAALQLFVDDFQAPVWKSHFRVTLDGRAAPDIETTINSLNQTGPIGKLVTLRLLPEYLDTLADGKLEIFIDDPTTNVGDGFAFDFVRLLINPKGFKYAGIIRGVVLDRAGGKPIQGALVSAANLSQATTGANGRFELSSVPAGLVITSGSHPEYITGSKQSDLLAGQALDIQIRLDRARDEDLAKRLDDSGKVDLYGIYFDTDKAVLKPASEATLRQLLALLKATPERRLMLVGHTDSQASDAYNLELSERRARAVVAWLRSKGIAADRLEARGLGEAQPVADNASEVGRRLNRRVEVRSLTK